MPDAGRPDSDGGDTDAGSADAGGTPDGGSSPDAGSPDAGSADGGAPDAGSPDGGFTQAPFAATPFAGRVLDVSLDAAGNAYVLLEYGESGQYRGVPLPQDGEPTFFHALVRQGPDGAVQWVRPVPTFSQTQSGEKRNVFGHQLAALPSGDVVLSGNFSETLTTPAGVVTGPPERETNQPLALFVARLSATGEWRWVRAFQGTHGVFAYELAASEGHIALAMRLQEGGLPAAGIPDDGRRGREGWRGLVLLLDTAGEPRGSHVFSAGRECEARGVALGAGDEVTLVGGCTRVGPPPGIGRVNPYVARLGPGGEVRWRWWGPLETDGFLADVAVGSAGEVVAVGNMRDTFEFAGRSISPSGSGTAVVLVFEPDGTPRWGRNVGRLFTPRVCLDARGRMVVAGSEGPGDFGSGPVDPGGTRQSVLAARLSLAGAVTHTWGFPSIDRYEESPGMETTELACAADGVALLSGYNGLSMRFGDVVSEDRWGSAGFLLELRQ